MSVEKSRFMVQSSESFSFPFYFAFFALGSLVVFSSLKIEFKCVALFFAFFSSFSQNCFNSTWSCSRSCVPLTATWPNVCLPSFDDHFLWSIEMRKRNRISREFVRAKEEIVDFQWSLLCVCADDSNAEVVIVLQKFIFLFPLIASCGPNKSLKINWTIGRINCKFMCFYCSFNTPIHQWPEIKNKNQVKKLVN